MIDVIIPTYQRTDLLKRVLPYYKAQKNVSSIIIVEDGPLSSEIAALEQVAVSPKVITIATGKQMGAPAAKRLGLERATAQFVAYGEDDAFPSPDYYARLVDHISNGLADVISGSVHYLSNIDEGWSFGGVSRVEDRPAFGVVQGNGTLLYGAATQALYLAERLLLLRHPPNPGYKGNGWREETDPLMALWEEGRLVALDPKAIFYHLPKNYQKGGGQHARNRIVYEYWCVRNDIYFFKKHKNSLNRMGFRGPAIYFSLIQFLKRWWLKLFVRFKKAKPIVTVSIPSPGESK